MKYVILLILGIAVGAGTVWFYNTGRETPTGRKLEDRATESLDKAQETAREIYERSREALDSRRDALSLSAQDIRKELSETGGVIHRKVQDMAEKAADAAEDTRITATVKARFAADPELSVFSISVNTTLGVVTLAGTVASYDLIGKAVNLALETEGVREVVSTLQVK